MYNDPSGEFIFAPLAAFLGSKILAAAVIGAGVGLVSYTVGLAVTGNIHQWSIGGVLKATIFGGIGGAVSFGVGSIFSNTAGTLTSFATNLKETIGGVGLAIVQAGTHAVSQGILSLMQGDSFGSSFTSAFLSSLGASGFGAIVGDWAGKAGGQIFFGALSGGIGAELSGGNFWQGATTSAIVVGLNHLAHMEKVEVVNDPPKEEGWLMKLVNAFSGGAIDEARAILAIDKMYAPGSKERIGAMVAISLRNSTSETFLAGNLGAWGNYRGRGGSFRMLSTTQRQLQAKFKHAIDFGITGNYNTTNMVKFKSVINTHINSPNIRVIRGTYHKQPAIHYVNPQTGLNVISKPNGQFWSGWKLSSDQLRNVLNHGNL